MKILVLKEVIFWLYSFLEVVILVFKYWDVFINFVIIVLAFNCGYCLYWIFKFIMNWDNWLFNFEVLLLLAILFLYFVINFNVFFLCFI